MNITTKAMQKRLLTGLAFFWAVGGAGGAFARASADEFLRATQAIASRAAVCAADADDLASEVTLRYLKSRRKGTSPTPTSRSYLFRSIHNIQREWFRKLKRVQVVPEVLEDERTEFLGLSTPYSDPSRSAEYREFLDSLTPEEHRVVQCLGEGSSEREIAIETGASRYRVRETIESLRARALHFVS